MLLCLQTFLAALAMSSPLLWGGLAVGALFGAASALGDFCLLRGLRAGDRRMGHAALRMFVLAMAVALVGTQWLVSQTDIDLSRSVYVQSVFSLPAVILGGAVFGLGMVMANSCGARALVLGASGNTRAWVVILCLGLGGYATLRGVLAPLRLWLASLGQVSLAPAHASLSSWTQALAHLPDERLWLLTGLFPGAVLAAWALRHPALHRHPRLWVSALGVGAAIVAGWAVSGYWLIDDFDPAPPVSLSYVVPVGQTMLYAMLASGMEMDFSVAAVVGTVLGAGVVAVLRRRLAWQGFEGARQMLRYMAGGVLMGIGGVLATGCSIGQGLSGFSTLAFQSLVAFAAIVAGTCLGLKIFNAADAASHH